MNTHPHHPAFHTKLTDGLTTREYFAAMAMQALIAGHPKQVHNKEEGCQMAVQYADALIVELNNTKNW